MSAVTAPATARRATEDLGDEAAGEPVPEPRPRARRPVPPTAGSSASRRRRPGTAVRLAVFHGGVLALVLGVVTVALVRQFSTSYEKVAARGLVQELRAFSTATSAPTGRCGLVTEAVSFFRNHELPAGTAVAIGVPGCRDVASGVAAAQLLASRQVVPVLRAAPSRATAHAERLAGAEREVLTAAITAGGRPVGSFVAAVDLTPFIGDRDRMLRLSVAEAAVALLAGSASAYWLLRRLLRTVGRITTTAEEIESGQLDRRLGDQGTDDEVGQLATTFDRMLDRVEGAMTSQRRLLSDVSHQLRTPLTVARGHLEVLQRTAVDDPAAVSETLAFVVDELDHMSALTDRLLLLGRAMEPDFLAPVPLDLRALLADVHAAAGVLAERRFVLGPVADVTIVADEAKLRGALLNLLDNAVKATGPGDMIRLSGAFDLRSGELLLTIDDGGPGIDASQRQTALARFSRPGADDDRGSGLGLAIAKAVAEAHGGSLEIDDSDLGGCRVTIRLPGSVIADDEVT